MKLLPLRNIQDWKYPIGVYETLLKGSYPANWAGRFSKKAVTPSLKSDVLPAVR